MFNFYLHIAMRTLERSVVCVTRERVTFEMKRRLERLAALRARLVLDVVVRQSGVLRQLFACLERMRTQRAHEQLQIGARVRGQVVVQRVLARELLLTRRTYKVRQCRR